MLWFLMGCAHLGIPMPGKVNAFAKGSAPIPQRSPYGQAIEPPELGVGKRVSEIALGLKGQTSLSVNGESIRYDCSGFVLATFALADVKMTGNTRSMFESAHRRSLLVSTPSLGDLVFFDNTYDRNKNKRLDDDLTHIAIVVMVESDGTIQMVHLGGSGITDLTMNLKHPTKHTSPNGKLWNSYLRINQKGETSPRLTGQLFKAFATIPR